MNIEFWENWRKTSILVMTVIIGLLFLRNNAGLEVTDKTIEELCSINPKMQLSYGYNSIINDVHHHVQPNQDVAFYMANHLNHMNEYGVNKTEINYYGARLEGGKEFERERDRQVLAEAKKCPERFYPFLAGVYPNESDSVDYVRENLKNEAWKGVGEIYIKNKYGENLDFLPNNSVMYGVYNILAEKRKSILIHYEPKTEYEVEAMENALRDYPNVTFIWAHSCGSPNDKKESYYWLLKYPNLYCEHEFYHGKEEKVLPINYANRFLIGTDTSIWQHKGQSYKAVLANARQNITKDLPIGLTEDLAYKNFERIIVNGV